MPTYEYNCESCGHKFDVYQSMKDKKLTKCPNCGQNTLKRLIGTGSGLIFKGSGFYLTDYKNKPADNPSSIKSDKTGDNKEVSKKQTEPTKSTVTKSTESNTKTSDKKAAETKSGD